MTKFMSWTMHKPANADFTKYADTKSSHWYASDWVIKNPDAPEQWDYRKTSFLRSVEKYHNKIDSIGLHEFMVNSEGRIYDYNGTTTSYILNNDKTDIDRPIYKSLRYLMHTYPNIKWAFQFVCFQDTVIDVLLEEPKWNIFLDECYKIMKIYLDRGFPVKMVEIDFEYTWYNTGVAQATIYKRLLERIKNEVCIPLNLELRVNLFAMTGDENPHYYGWHDYRTLASGVDKNGNQAIDEFQLMTYDFSWGGSAPGASTPIWWLENVLKHVANVLPPHKTYIGNAGYGRRWSLGQLAYPDLEIDGCYGIEGYANGVTLDFKQMQQVHNGTHLHNHGNQPDGSFLFSDQQFLPLCGFNDDESDYQKTYMHTYDRFAMTSNGGATFKNLNRSSGADYVTKYSTEQCSIFTNVIHIANEVTEKSGLVDSVQDKFIIKDTITGIKQGTEFKGYRTNTKYTGNETDADGNPIITQFKYNIPKSGSYRTIMVVSFPFYDKNRVDFKFNGRQMTASAELDDLEWYPFGLLQKPHFYDLGTLSYSGNDSFTFDNTKGVIIYGFILCSNYEENMSGGDVIMSTDIQPMYKRGTQASDGYISIVKGSAPKRIRVVGECLRRAPRPTIIWEDTFGSYLSSYEDPTDINNLSSYYVKANSETSTGFTKGNWTVYPASEEDYAYLYSSNTTSYNQFALNHKFRSNIMCEIEVRATTSNTVYGFRFLAPTKGSSDTGYLVLLDFGNKVAKFTREDGTVIKSASISGLSYSTRRTVQLLNLNGKMSLWVGGNCIMKEITVPNNVEGAYGLYVSNGGIKVYKYNISSLDRWERMERFKVTIDGKEYNSGSVPRTCKVDKFGNLIYTGYPYDMNNVYGMDKTIRSTQKYITSGSSQLHYLWDVDYKNERLAVLPTWTGKKEVKVTMVDPGIWLKTIYFGDDEGMSVAYNSDKIAFYKTANLVHDYGCKGIAMWTLGQEDTSVLDYLP